MSSGTVKAGLGFSAATVPFCTFGLLPRLRLECCVVEIVRLRASSDSIFLRIACAGLSGSDAALAAPRAVARRFGKWVAAGDVCVRETDMAGCVQALCAHKNANTCAASLSPRSKITRLFGWPAAVTPRRGTQNGKRCDVCDEQQRLTSSLLDCLVLVCAMEPDSEDMGDAGLGGFRDGGSGELGRSGNGMGECDLCNAPALREWGEWFEGTGILDIRETELKVLYRSCTKFRTRRLSLSSSARRAVDACLAHAGGTRRLHHVLLILELASTLRASYCSFFIILPSWILHNIMERIGGRLVYRGTVYNGQRRGSGVTKTTQVQQQQTSCKVGRISRL